jgi:hypothetical protein
MVRQVAVPADVRELSTLARVDYADAFVVDTRLTPGQTPEQWLRAMLEGAPLATRKALRWTWRALGLRLGPESSSGLVCGWELRRSTPDHVLLGARSRIGMPAELLLQRREDSLLFDTFVRHGNPLARVVWAGTVPRHRPVVRSILERAARAST